MSGWMEGYADDVPAPRPAAGAAKPIPIKFPDTAASGPSWAPGQDTVLVRAICCPSCGSVEVSRHDNGKSSTVIRWQCPVCSTGFKRDAEDVKRVYLAE
jgi:predicted RNA-binding Zn-ribbon protein involved in translation (DUF1610 family)